MELAFQIFGWIIGNILMFEILATSFMGGLFGSLSVMAINEHAHPAIIFAIGIIVGLIILFVLLKVRKIEKGFLILSIVFSVVWVILFWFNITDLGWRIFWCIAIAIISGLLHIVSKMKMDKPSAEE